MLPKNPDTVGTQTTFPPIPDGLEEPVDDLRAQITEEAANLHMIRDFNAFAFNFVCEELVDEIDEVRVLADDRLVEKNNKLNSVLNDLYVVHGRDDESRLDFETRLRGEYAIALSE